MVCKAGQLCLIKFFRFSKAEDIILANDRVLLYESTSVKDLFAYIEVNCQIPAGSFNLNFASADILTDLSEMKDKTMSEIGMDFSFDPDSTENKHILLITDPDNAEQKQTEYPTVVPASPHRSSVWGEDNVDFKSFIKSETSYVGLVNQAMTCYLNSLLQALYMTPEFRNALYNWEYVKGSEEDEVSSIPYQLQKLFLNLQTSTKSAVETTALTKSFGWDSTQAWQQHDIQELCRVMFDALEENFQNTEQADLINSLYEGKMTDYVKCLECGTEKSREDTFLDIPLPVRPFGSNVAYDSVEEALQAFVQYETLEGNNQYHCEKCNKKCDAHKGLKFTKFPYLLTLHLKRFDFDFKTFHRIKLNDKVTFPDILNLSPFISSTTSQESPSGDENINLVKCDDSSTTDSGTLDDDYPSCENSLPNSNHSTNHDQDDDEGIDVINSPSTSNCTAHSEENEENHDNNSAEEPYQYELFSIMIHSGSASGGHYYAYIKDFRTQEWLSFNDQSVTQITHDDIQKTYGGGSSRPYYSGAYSSTTAYMLMYRQIDPVRNTLPMQVQDFPKHIQELLKKMKENEHSSLLEDHSLLVRGKKKCFDSRRRMSTYDVITTKVYVVDVSKKKIINGPLNVRALRTETVREYKQIIGKLFEMNPDEVKLVLRKNETDTVLLQNDDAELLSTEFPNPVNVFVLTMFDTNEYEPFYETAMYEFIENFENIITVHVNLPDISKEILEELNIPTLEEKYKDKEKPIAKSPSNVSVNELHRDNGPKSNEVPSAKNGKSNEDAPVRNTSPQLGEGEEWNTPEQSNSEDSSLSDSDKTLVGDAPEDDDFQLPYLSSSTSNCAIEMLNQIGLENTDNSNDDSQYYFQVTPYMTNKLKFLKVLVDKRMKLSTLKKRLEPYVGVSAEYFKIFNHFQDTGESDCDYLLKHLVSYDDAKLYITLHRALRDGEFAVKLYQFAIDSQDPYKFLCEWIISKGMTVGQTKKEILAEIKRKYDIDIPYERCRLRKKTFRLASEVFLDDQKLDDSLFYLQREMIIQELPDKEPVTSSDQIVLFVRRWSPSEMKLGPLQEIVIDEKSIDEMRKKLALISDIPVKHIGVERAMVTVPTNVSFPRIQHDVKWQGNTIDELLDIENGVVILYKDNRETSTNHQSIKHQIPLAELYRNFPFSSVRKEKALKIHMGAK